MIVRASVSCRYVMPTFGESNSEEPSIAYLVVEYLRVDSEVYFVMRS